MFFQQSLKAHPAAAALLTRCIHLGIKNTPTQHRLQNCTNRPIRTLMAVASGDLSAQQHDQLSPRVLSIQSSVVHGYVGNKAAVFPLQLLGFDVDPVYSVQLSNHTGYPLIKGHVFDGAHLHDLLAGLTANRLICHTHLLTGYIGSVSLLQAVAAVAQELRKVNPQLTYVCDPVLGDEGKLYVSGELLEAYKNSLVPLADILTPNQFEAELLTGLQVATEQQALAAAQALHEAGPHTVVITSLAALPHPEYNSPPGSISGADEQQQQQEQQQQPQQQQEQQSNAPQDQQQQQQLLSSHGHIVLVASTKVPQADGSPATFRLKIPKLPGYFTGTGDLLAALLLARIHERPSHLASAVELAVAGLQGVLAATAAAAGLTALAAGADDRSAEVFKAKELRLIQAQGALLKPAVTIKAQALSSA